MALTQVSTNGVKDGSLLNADVNGSAAIAGTKISPNFGSQNILTTGKAGIGTASPSNTLHVIGTGNDKGIDLTSSGAHALRFKIDSNPSNANDTIFFQSARWIGTEVASIHMRAGADTTNKDDGRLTFHTATSGSSTAERMRRDSSGRLLVGTGTGTGKFIVQDSSLPKIQANFNAAAHFELGVGGSGGGFAITTGHSTTFNHQPFANRGTDTNLTTRLTITSTGNLESAGVIVGASGLTQVDNAQSLISQSSVGSATHQYFIGNAQIQVSSDRRIKENIVDTSLNAITELNKVRVVDFNWNDPQDKAINNKNSRGKWTGCIAQEIVNIFPHSVNAPRPKGKEIDYDSEHLWTMEYEHLVPVLIKAVQELSTKVAALESL